MTTPSATAPAATELFPRYWGVANERTMLFSNERPPAGTSALVMEGAALALLAQNAELLALARRYASECGECYGTGSVATKDDFGVSDTACGYCAHIRSVIARCSP